ncbi:MAG TPA: glycoside hydrolase family 16 protein, partial [Clostridiales bacterium]|nr:glycoside hydrolase family 16 protein [Clostridiales bacterium]
MNNKKTNKTCLQKKLLSLVLVISMTFSSLLLSLSSILVAEAAQTTITSMNYYSAADGPVITASGVDSASYGFVMPIFNGGNASWEDVSSDLAVNVMLNGEWTNIDDGTDFVYNQNWGHWHDGGFSGYWFMVSENTQIQLVSIANDVELNYTLEFTNIETTTISSMNLTQGPELTADATGSIGFTYPIFNGDTAIPYEAVAKDLKVYVKTLDSSQWIDIDDNAASG